MPGSTRGKHHTDNLTWGAFALDSMFFSPLHNFIKQNQQNKTWGEKKLIEKAFSETHNIHMHKNRHLNLSALYAHYSEGQNFRRTVQPKESMTSRLPLPPALSSLGSSLPASQPNKKWGNTTHEHQPTSPVRQPFTKPRGLSTHPHWKKKLFISGLQSTNHMSHFGLVKSSIQKICIARNF